MGRRACAESLVNAGRYGDAIPLYRDLLEEDPDNIDVLVGLGELCLRVNDQATAAIFFRRVITLDRSNMPASRGLARIASGGESGLIPGDGTPLKVRVIRPLPLWDTDEKFVAIMSQISYSLVDRTRCYMLYQFARDAAGLPGEVAEVGVYRGGTARLLARTFEGTGKPVHLFDTFEGMPSTDPSKDAHREGDFSDTSLASVQKNLSGCENVLFYPGYFPATSPPIEQSRFCLVHIDVDIYRSVLDCCAFFYPRMVPGGKMVFDDYGYETCPGAKLAVDEFFRDTPERPFYLPSGQCFVTKRSPTVQ
ncbi:MAG TPA: TylF/MycF/NovP-related O-methyltransferase [Bacteroidota bacterium]|nr:TylF/MycF/NovP-related O-methyltransferase [Bacteroidota bacterium]